VSDRAHATAASRRCVKTRGVIAVREKPTPVRSENLHAWPHAEALFSSPSTPFLEPEVLMSWRLSKHVGALLLLALTGIAQAVVLPPGTTLNLPGTTVAADPALAGVVEVDELVPFSFAANGGTISGDVQVRVVRSSVDNTLDFYWRVFNDIESSGVIGSFRIGDFVTGVYDANWRIDGLGDVAPTSATRFSGAFDSFVNFNFGDLLAPGLQSRFILLDTTAVDYARNAIYDLTNFGQTQISGLFSTYAPVAKVPEPGSVALFAMSLAMLGWVARRRVPRSAVA
jgi:hypothetical protein